MQPQYPHSPSSQVLWQIESHILNPFRQPRRLRSHTPDNNFQLVTTRRDDFPLAVFSRNLMDDTY